MWLDILFIPLGTVLLLGGGEVLVRGATSIARGLGVSPMIIGLTVVAYGTSSPELVVSGFAAWQGNPAICGGNIIGSNILNVLLVLGTTALIYPIVTTAGFVRREVPIMVGACGLFWLLVLNGTLDRMEAAIFLLLLFGYTILTIRLARREQRQKDPEFADVQSRTVASLGLSFLLVFVGLALLGGGSEIFLRGAIGIARHLGISEAMIGLTLVAMGTSFPELAASLVAAWRKHPDICLGNIVGSSIYNVLAIGGVAGLIAPLPIDAELLKLHVPVMVVAAVVLWIIVTHGLRVARWHGALLLAIYAGYMGWVIARNT